MLKVDMWEGLWSVLGKVPASTLESLSNTINALTAFESSQFISDSSSCISFAEMNWFPSVSGNESLLFPFPNRRNGFFHSLPAPEFWSQFFTSFPFPNFGNFFFMPLLFPNFEMEFSIPFPICEVLKVNPSHPCWGLLLILLFPCSYTYISRSPPYIGRQQWIYGGGCSWYFVPLSTLILMLVSCTTLSLFLPIFECPHI